MTVSGVGGAAPARGAALMSIGEVLAQLRGDFPDITISKLRFLEAEGLVEPQRTASGYRKYTSPDLTRLRFVLTAQRDHYLPLRVIREQLAALERSAPAGEIARAAFESGSTPAPDTGTAADPGSPRRHGQGIAPGATDPGSTHRPVPGTARGGSVGRPASGHDGSGADLTGLAPLRPALLAAVDDAVPSRPADVRLSRAELLDRSGLAEPVLAELEQHGLVRAAGARYDADALAIARVAAQLAEYGLEPRHLRAYRTAADREVGLFTQLVAPVARQTSPAARARAAETVRELAALSQQLHAALVRVGLRGTLGQ